MLFDDTYNTIECPAEAIFKDKGSKFLAFAFPVRTEEEIKEHLNKLKQDHHTANHHCYAFRLGADKSAFRSNDDGEPANTAGKPILGQIQSKDLTNILIVVVRYFGGTLLGVSGLINAYKTAAAAVLQNSKIFECTVNEEYEVLFSHEAMGEVMKLLKDEKVTMYNQKFELNCSLLFSIRKSHADMLIGKLKKTPQVTIKYRSTT